MAFTADQIELMRVGATILKLKPDFSFDNVGSLLELQREYVVLSMPAKAAELRNLSLDNSPQGQINQGRIEGYFESLTEIASTNAAIKSQRDSDLSKADLNKAVGSLKASSVITQPQMDESEKETEKARNLISNAWRR